LELVCWLTDSVSELTLLASAIYSIYKLRAVQGGAIIKVANRMTLIMIVFCAAFGIKTGYQWTMFYKHNNGSLQYVGIMLKY
jgi:hypothetical protein